MSIHDAPSSVRWCFPTDASHDGMPLGNGTFGALLWGAGEVVSVTINRQDYWNRENEAEFSEVIAYEGLWERLHDREPQDAIRVKLPHFPLPTRLPMGRFDLRVSEPLIDGELDLATGEARIGPVRSVLIREQPVLLVKGRIIDARPVPNESEEVRRYREAARLDPPQAFDEGAYRGWTQALRGQPAMCAMAKVTGEGVAIVSVYGESPVAARAAARGLLDGAPAYDEAAQRVAGFYRDFWARVARVKVAHRPTQVLYDLGMFKLSGAAAPDAPPITLQGPWVEDDRMPPWGCDYHFNVNVQMCYWPALAGGVAEVFPPLARMLQGFVPRMLEAGRLHVGLDDAMLLSHGADDRGIPADLSWQNQIDAGSLPWVALTLWEAYRYFGDRETAREVTYPLMHGAMRLYQGQLERNPEGAWRLPYGASPEYNEDGNIGWGPNASFQLGLIHALIRTLGEASRDLQIDEPRLGEWQAIAASLPKASIQDGEIQVWDGQRFDSPHRHPSHLLGLWPFEVFHPDADRELLEGSFGQWTRMGTGDWSGWGTAFAALLHAHLRNPTGAFHMLDSYRRFFTGPVNHASRHNAHSPGFTSNLWGKEIMQLDAAMGAVAAIQHMVAHEQNGEPVLAPAVPDDWGDVSFARIRLPGGGTASGERTGGIWKSLHIDDAIHPA